MNKEDLFNEFIKHIDNIGVFDNFIFIVSKNGYKQYVKDSNDLFSNIVLTGIDCNIDFGASITFKSIESLMNVEEIMDWVNDRSDCSIRMYEHTVCTGYEFFKGFANRLPINIDSQQAIATAIELAQKANEQDIKPFFAYWHNITVLIPWLETERHDDWARINKPFGANALDKKLITWYQTNHPKYKEFKNFHLERFKSLMQEDPCDKELKEYLLSFESLIARLEKTSPIYEWNDSYLIPKPFKGVVPKIN